MKGIALEGGSSKGAYHLGVLKALFERGYKFKGAVGTSIGAFNAAMIVQGDFDVCYNMWKNMQPETLFNVDNQFMENLLDKNIDRSMLEYASTEAKKVIANKGIDTTKLRRILDTYIDEDKIRTSEMDFGLVTVEFDGLKPVPVEIFKEDIPKGKIKDYIMASANLPVFKSEDIDGKFFIDGGFYDNCPLRLLESKGYDDLIAVRVSPNRKLREPIKEDTKFIEIKPSEPLGRGLIFSNDTIRRNMLRGYFDRIKKIEGLKGNKYYIDGITDDEFMNRLISYPDEKILPYAESRGVVGKNPKRILFENLIPETAEALKMGKDATYQDIFIELLESIAEGKKIKKFKVYSLDEFIDCINKSEDDDSSSSKLSELKKAAFRLAKPIEKITPITFKESILKEFEESMLDDIGYHVSQLESYEKNEDKDDDGWD